MFKFRVMVVVLLMFLLSFQSVNGQEEELADITLFLTYIPNIQYAPVYVGLEKGYFEEAGFNVELEYGDEPIGVDLIATGERPFGLISGEQIIAARANGRPVVFVYEWYQKYPIGIVTSVDSGIESVEDLRGRTVGIPGRFGASYTSLLALLAANDMTEEDIQLEEIGFNAPEVFCLERVEAAVVYVNNEPLQIQSLADQNQCSDVTEVRTIPVSDTIDLVSNGIVTNEEFLTSNPDQVAAIVNAFDRALIDTIANPAEAYLLSAAYIENLPLSDEFSSALTEVASESENQDAEQYEALSESFTSTELLQLQVLLATIDLWEAELNGFSDRTSWETTQDALLAADVLDTEIDLDAAFTNEFLPEDE
jgi:NitT/TauT family transport system substrate-binding protein